jgi:hypothetical protein
MGKYKNVTILRACRNDCRLANYLFVSFTFLHAACGYAREEVIRWMLELNKEAATIDVNARDGDGDTPLHHCDDVNSAKLLIEGGADFRLRNDEGLTALDVKEEELKEGDDDDDDSDDEDREKLKELVEYLKSIQGDQIE